MFGPKTFRWNFNELKFNMAAKWGANECWQQAAYVWKYHWSTRLRRLSLFPDSDHTLLWSFTSLKKIPVLVINLVTRSRTLDIVVLPLSSANIPSDGRRKQVEGKKPKSHWDVNPGPWYCSLMLYHLSHHSGPGYWTLNCWVNWTHYRDDNGNDDWSIDHSLIKRTKVLK